MIPRVNSADYVLGIALLGGGSCSAAACRATCCSPLRLLDRRGRGKS